VFRNSDVGKLLKRKNTIKIQDGFSGCSPTTNADNETGQMAVCCQNLTLGVPSSRSALSMLVGGLFKKFGLFLNTPRILLPGHFSVSLVTVCEVNRSEPTY
jgi:hypothetical protein